MMKSESKNPSIFKKIADSIVHEAVLSYKINRNDLYGCFIFPMVAIGALAGNESVEIAVQVFIRSVIIGWFFIYTHTAANQDTGLEEDKINKPFRPYPQGFADPRYATFRLGVVMFVYHAISYLANINLPAIVHSASVIWYNYLKGDKSSFGRLVYTIVGVTVAYYTPWVCVTGYLPDKSLASAHKWFPVVFYVAAVTSILQDFRDVQGDAKIGRVTYPIKYGDKCRTFIVFTIATTPVVALYYFEMFIGSLHILKLVYWLFLATSCSLLSYRLMYLRDPASDAFTYSSWCFLAVTFFMAPLHSYFS